MADGLGVTSFENLNRELIQLKDIMRESKTFRKRSGSKPSGKLAVASGKFLAKTQVKCTSLEPWSSSILEKKATLTVKQD